MPHALRDGVYGDAAVEHELPVGPPQGPDLELHEEVLSPGNYSGRGDGMYCPGCGRSVQEDLRLCPYCGRPVGENAVVVQQTPIAQKKGMSRPTIVAVVVALVVAVIAVILVL
jgi:RNA polymerase subunit RPABC4/transcription elongation factor Spt4